MGTPMEQLQDKLWLLNASTGNTRCDLTRCLMWGTTFESLFHRLDTSFTPLPRKLHWHSVRASGLETNLC